MRDKIYAHTDVRNVLFTGYTQTISKAINARQCVILLSAITILFLQPHYYHRHFCLSPDSSLIYPPVHHFSKCGHGVGDTECLSALGQIKNQQINVPLTGVPIVINQQKQEMANQKTLWCIKSTLGTRRCLPASLHFHFHEPKVSKHTSFYSVYSCTFLYLGCHMASGNQSCWHRNVYNQPIAQLPPTASQPRVIFPLLIDSLNKSKSKFSQMLNFINTSDHYSLAS